MAARIVTQDGQAVQAPPDMAEQLLAYRNMLSQKIAHVDSIIGRIKTDPTLAKDFQIMAAIAVENYPG